VWLGDSLTRYEYLQLVYQIHNDGPGVEDAKMGGWGQGLTSVYFSAQPEPFLTQNTP